MTHFFSNFRGYFLLPISYFQPPYYGNEVEKTADNDINFIEQPVVPTQPAEPTNVVPQQPNNNYNDPSIISRPKNSNTRSTSFFAQPGTLAGKSLFFCANFHFWHF